MAVAELYAKRDAKVRPHLEQYAPVWIIDQKLVPADESLLFEVLFQHNLYGWVNRRYVYDGFNNVLYHKGQILAGDDLVAEVTAKEPYITVLIADIPNAYGG
ncbi:MAG: hypothetical protein IPK52_05700 [Chloroflexi bacterium]|nr:hypothetical protein [Chloroflexota bacterium]